MLIISLQSTMEFITTTKGKPALIFDGSRFTINKMTMEYATGDVQKGMKGMMSKSKLHHTIMLWM